MFLENIISKNIDKHFGLEWNVRWTIFLEFRESRGVAEGDDQTSAAQDRHRGRLQRQTLGS